MIVCKLPELDLPLGIEIKGLVQGLDISYETPSEELLELMKDNMSISSAVTKTSVGGSLKIRSKKQKELDRLDRNVKSFDFKMDVNKSSTKCFVIKNKSAIQTNFKLRLKNFNAFEGDFELMQTSSLIQNLTDKSK